MIQKERGGEGGLGRDYSSKRKKEIPTTRVLIYSLATLSSSSHVVNLSLGLFLRLPSLVSVESIFSQALNCTNLTFRLSNKWSRPSLPGLGKLAFDVNRLRSSDILTTYHINRTNQQTSKMIYDRQNLNSHKRLYFFYFISK